MSVRSTRLTYSLCYMLVTFCFFCDRHLRRNWQWSSHDTPLVSRVSAATGQTRIESLKRRRCNRSRVIDFSGNTEAGAPC